MSPKKVWSIILVVLGVFLIMSGVRNYSDLNFAEGMMSESDAKLTKLYGAKIGTAGSDILQKMIDREKVLSVIRIICGIMISIFGALMIKKTEPEPAFEPDDDYEIGSEKEPSFKF